MTRHSKNSNSSGFYGSAERNKIRSATASFKNKHQRLGVDAMRKIDTCLLCLQTAVIPVVCPDGHVTCKECILKNLHSQKNAIKAKRKDFQKKALIRHEIQQKSSKEAEEQRIASFCANQASIVQLEEAENKIHKFAECVSSETSRKHLSAADSLVLNTVDCELKTGLQAVCPGDAKRALSMHDLVDIHFAYPPGVSGKDQPGAQQSPSCGCCLKEFKKGFEASVCSGCGSVLCDYCIKDVLQQRKCSDCVSSTVQPHSFWIALQCEGTGYSSKSFG